MHRKKKNKNIPTYVEWRRDIREGNHELERNRERKIEKEVKIERKAD